MRNWKIGAWGAALVTMLGLFQPASPWLAEKSYDLLFHLRPEIRVENENVAIIYMDDKSHEELGQAGDDLWDRSQHAELVRHLTSYRAKAIVFDIWFDQAGSNDLVFLNSITKATNAGIPVLVGATTLDTRESHYSQLQ